MRHSLGLGDKSWDKSTFLLHISLIRIYFLCPKGSVNAKPDTDFKDVSAPHMLVSKWKSALKYLENVLNRSWGLYVNQADCTVAFFSNNDGVTTIII